MASYASGLKNSPLKTLVAFQNLVTTHACVTRKLARAQAALAIVRRIMIATIVY